jgi:thiol-disulfide isomerase/thioredoxin
MFEALLPEGTDPPEPDAVVGPASPPPPPKPRFFGPYFWTGFGFGVLAFLFLFVAGAAILVFWVTRTMSPRSSLGKSPGSSPGSFLSAPPFPAAAVGSSDFTLGLENPDGTPFDASAVRGKTVFLNYWATWCGPCRAEMPAIQRLFDRTRDLGVVFLVVSDEKPGKIAEYLKKNAFTMPVYRSTKGRPPGFETSAIPATFILAADGRVAFSHVGAAGWDDDSTLTFLRSLSPASH